MTDARQNVRAAVQLEDLLTSVAAVAGPLVAFDRIGLALVDGVDTIRVISKDTAGTGEPSEQRFSRHQCSDRLWPRVDTAAIGMHHASHELDANYDVDRCVSEGYGSILVLPLDVWKR